MIILIIEIKDITESQKSAHSVGQTVEHETFRVSDVTSLLRLIKCPTSGFGWRFRLVENVLSSVASAGGPGRFGEIVRRRMEIGCFEIILDECL